MILAGDVGGTHARLALFGDDEREPVALEIYPSADHAGLPEIVEAFRAAHPGEVVGASFGVAGPVDEGRTEAVNLAWPVDAGELARALKLERAEVSVINDMEANAWGIAALADDDLVVLHDARGEQGGTVALISAGTGLGEGFATWGESELRAHASEGGHVDFAPRSDLQAELRDWLARDGKHVSYERVCSGMGILNIYDFLRERSSQAEPEWLAKERAAQGAVAITHAGLERRDRVASEALDLMVSVYGAQAGNLALTLKATGGVYLGGGIAPKVLPRLREGGFMRAFTDKGRLSELLERIPVRVILNELTALLGAARHARTRRSRTAPSA
ncbi:MAG TPA: glucokinase [Solirubrobacterales bacterium]|nr:glucokinase [Solirubrobacterales bacterium]